MYDCYDNPNYDLDNLDDLDEYDNENSPAQPSHRTILYRRQTKRNKLNKRRKIINNYGYTPHVGYIDYGFVNGKWQPIGNHIKYSKNSNCQRWMKRQTSKRARKTDLPNGNAYRRVFDYWWTLY